MREKRAASGSPDRRRREEAPTPTARPLPVGSGMHPRQVAAVQRAAGNRAAAAYVSRQRDDDPAAADEVDAGEHSNEVAEPGSAAGVAGTDGGGSGAARPPDTPSDGAGGPSSDPASSSWITAAQVIAGDWVGVPGSGTEEDPYDMTAPETRVTGSGSEEDPLVFPDDTVTGGEPAEDSWAGVPGSGTEEDPYDMTAPETRVTGSGSEEDPLVFPDDTVTGGEPEDAGDLPAGIEVSSHSQALEAMSPPATPRPPTRPLPPDPGLQEYRSGFTQAAHDVEDPDVSELTEMPGEIREQADEIDTSRREARPDHDAEAREALPDQPETEEPIPAPPPDPVPGATALIERQANVRLPDQTLPDPVRSPGVDDDRWNVHLSGLLPGERPPPPPAPEPVAIDPVTGSPAAASETDPQMASARVEAARPREQEERRASPEDPIQLRDQGPPDSGIGVPEGLEVDLEEVLASLLAGIDGVGERFVDAAESQAFARNALRSAAPQIADAARDSITDELRTEIHGIGEAAGIGVDALTSRAQDIRDGLQRTGDEVDTGITDADAAATEQTDRRTEEDQELIRGAAEANEDHVAATKEAATGEADPAYIEAKADRLISKLQGDAAEVRAGQRAAKEQRERELDGALATMTDRYNRTADAQARRIRSAFESARPVDGGEVDAEAQRQAGLTAAGPTIRWARRNIAAVTTRVAELKRQLTRVAREHATSLNADERAAVEMVRDWRDERLDQERSWWERLIDLFTDWGERAVETSEAWEETRNRVSRDQAVGDLQLIGQLRDARQQRLPARLAELQEGLDAAQTAVVQTYAATGSAVEAVKAGMITRIGERRITEMTDQFVADAEKLEDEAALEQLGVAQTPGFNATTVASNVHLAIDGVTTDESMLFSALSGKTPIQIKAVRLRYQSLYDGADMEADIRGDLSGEEEDRADQLLAGDQMGAEIAELRYAMTTWSGTDEDAIMRVLRNKTPEEREELVRRYREMYGADLDADLEGDLSGMELERAQALREGDVARADAIAVDQAMNETTLGIDWGTDEEGINAVYTNIRAEVEAEARRTGMTVEEMEAEIRRRNAEIDQNYGARHGDDPDALRDAFGEELSDAELDLARAYRDGDATAIDAAAIRVEERALFNTDDDVILDRLRAQRERAEMESELDLRAEFETERRTSDWTPEEEQRRRQQLQEDIRAEADRRAESNMDALEEIYDDRYSRWGPGGLQVVVAFSMGGQDQDEARDLIRQHGRLTPAQEMRYAVEGAGTDEDRIRRVLRDPNDPSKLRSPEELAELRAEYRQLTGRDLDDDLRGDLDGRDAFDIIEQDMLGEPQTPEERLRRLQARERFERSDGFTAEDAALSAVVPAYGVVQGVEGIADYMAADEAAALAIGVNDAEAQLREYRQMQVEYGDDHPRTQEALARFNRRVGGANTLVENHRAAVDSAADTMATVAGVAAGIAVTVATAGTAGPAVIAAGAALAATAATVTVKAAVLGDAYGVESIGTDLAIGGVDVAAAVATAGVGNALLRTGALKRLVSGGVTRQVGTRTVTEGVEGALGAIPSGMAGAMLDDATWRSDDPLGRIAQAGGQAGATGFIMSGGMHVGGETLSAVRSRRSGETGVPPELETPPPPGQTLPGAHDVGTPLVPEMDPPPSARGDNPMTDAAVTAGDPVPVPRGPDAEPHLGDDTLVDVPALGEDTQVDLPALGDGARADVDAVAATRVDGDAPAPVQDAHPEIPWATADEIDGMVMMAPDARSQADAYQMYGNSIRENPHLEVAVYRNVETGEYLVIQGNGQYVSPHGEAAPSGDSTAAWAEILDAGSNRGRWELESHSHPVQDGRGVTDQIMVPSGASGDLGVVLHESLSSGGQPRTSRIHGQLADGSLAHTDFGFDPSHSEPFWVDRPIGTQRPGEPIRRDVQRFESLEHYNEFLESVGFAPSEVHPAYADGGWRDYLPGVETSGGPAGPAATPRAAEGQGGRGADTDTPLPRPGDGATTRSQDTTTRTDITTAGGGRPEATADVEITVARPGEGPALTTVDQPAGVTVDPESARLTFGMPVEIQSRFQDLAANGGDHLGRPGQRLVIDVRPTNPESLPYLEAGTGVPKPADIKSKTINELDVLMGAARPDQIGQVGFLRNLPRELPVDPPEGITPEKWGRVRDRHAKRLRELDDYGDVMAALELDPASPAGMEARARHGVKDPSLRIEIVDGAVHVHEDGAVGRPFVGDHDIFDIRWADGMALTQQQHDALIAIMQERGMNVAHGMHMEWVATGSTGPEIYAGIIARHGAGGDEALLRFDGAGMSTARAGDVPPPDVRGLDPGDSYVMPEGGGSGRVHTPEPEVVRLPTRARARVRHARDLVDALEDAFAQGRTLQGDPLPTLTPRESARIADAIADLRTRLARFRMPVDAAAREAAVDALMRRLKRQMKSGPLERLRGDRNLFEVTTGGRTTAQATSATPEHRQHARDVRSRVREAFPAHRRRIVTPEGVRPVEGATATPSPRETMDLLDIGPLEVTGTGDVLLPRARTGLEGHYLTSGGADGGSNTIRGLETEPPELAEIVAQLVDGYERAHLVGPGFGGELWDGMMLAPRGVNQVAQNRGIEAHIRMLAESGPVRVRVTADGRQLAIPLADGTFEQIEILQRVEYVIEGPDGPRRVVIEVTDPPNGSWEITTNELPSGTVGHDVLIAGPESPSTGTPAAVGAGQEGE